jgi:hypothetical protein
VSLTVEYCMLIYSELDDSKKSSQLVARKCRRELAETVAQVLLDILDLDNEEFVGAILNELDTMPINWFDSVLDYDSKLAEIYNNN